MTTNEILARLPYTYPFLFVDELIEVSDEMVSGNYTFKPDEFFYSGHFKNMPVTPGVILIETMAQIGLVCLGMYLFRDELARSEQPEIAFLTADAEFLAPVFPGEKVIVQAEKIYFRFNKLKCKVDMRNSRDELVCTGTLSGFIKFKK